MHYIVVNPVRHGYVSAVTGWAWSCYHDLLTEYGEKWVDDLIRQYPLLDFGEKWDPPDM